MTATVLFEHIHCWFQKCTAQGANELRYKRRKAEQMGSKVGSSSEQRARPEGKQSELVFLSTALRSEADGERTVGRRGDESQEGDEWLNVMDMRV